jgi:hypothetical protein
MSPIADSPPPSQEPPPQHEPDEPRPAPITTSPFEDPELERFLGSDSPVQGDEA